MDHEGQYKIASINPRSEADGEGHQVAVDVNLENAVTAGTLREIFRAGQIENLLQGLVDEAGLPRNTGVALIKLDCGFDDCTVRIRTGVQDERDVIFAGCKIVKFVIKPTPAGTLNLNFQVQAHPDDGDLDKLADALKEHCLVKMSGQAIETAPVSEAQTGMDFDDEPAGAEDALYDDAVKMILDAGQVDEEAIQANFDIGYARCAKLLEAIADAGFITTPDESGQREVLLRKKA